jgi:hypothetical protein
LYELPIEITLLHLSNADGVPECKYSEMLKGKDLFAWAQKVRRQRMNYLRHQCNFETGKQSSQPVANVKS